MANKDIIWQSTLTQEQVNGADQSEIDELKEELDDAVIGIMMNFHGNIQTSYLTDSYYNE